jgi:protein O-GlcNAc transferase
MPAMYPAWLVAFLLAVPMTAQTTSIDLANKAEILIRDGHTQEGRALLQQAAAAPGRSAQSEDKIGFLLAVLGESAGAHEHFKQAISIDPGYAPAHYHLGAADWLADEKQEAIRELEIAVHLKPATSEYRYRLGIAYLNLSDFDKASDELKQATNLDGAGEPAWRSLAQALQAKGDLLTAISAYQRALQLKDDDDDARNELSALLVETRQPGRGIEEANRVLKHDPHNFSAQMNLGYAYLKTGDYAKAEAAYQGAVQSNQTSAAPHYDLGIALKMQDQLDAARGEFRKAVALDPKLAEAQYSIGIIDWQSGDFPAMVSAMKAAIAMRPDYAQAHYMLGIALKETGSFDEAIAELREAIQLDPSTPGPFNTLGQILRRKGDQRGSAEAFATGARLKKEKDSDLANNLDQGMRGGETPKPISGVQAH